MRRAGRISVTNQICRNCQGHGKLAQITKTDFDSVKCPVCNGSGMVIVKKVISVIITPKTQCHE